MNETEDREQVWRYLNDPEFHAKVEVGAQAIMSVWDQRADLRPRSPLAWPEAKLLAYKVVLALEAAGA